MRHNKLNQQQNLIKALNSQEKRKLLKKILNEEIKQKKSNGVKSNVSMTDQLLPNLIQAPNDQNNPFPLNEIQQAYWIGRGSSFEFGNVSAHVYFELDSTDIDIERLEKAWGILISRHNMLRAIVLDNGTQQVLPDVPHYHFETTDLREVADEQSHEILSSIREHMSHQLFDSNVWPLFEIRVTRIDEKYTRLHFGIDILIADARSILLMIQEWRQLYLDPTLQLPKINVSFRDYLISMEHIYKTQSFQHSLRYWRNKIADLPAAPALPINLNTITGKPRFTRRTTTIDKETWQRLKMLAQDNDITPSGILLAAYAEILYLWSHSSRFSINLTFFNRLPVHPNVNDLVGDFTSLILLAVDHSQGETFVDRASIIQERLWENLEHSSVSAIRVLREMAKEGKRNNSAPMPVVFTSLLNEHFKTEESALFGWLGETVYSVSQTPQVWLDNQTYETAGMLNINWDAVENLFPEGMLDDMFSAYQNLIEQLSNNYKYWRSNNLNLLPRKELQFRQQINQTEATRSNDCLHTLFEKRVQRSPNAIAVVSKGEAFSYLQINILSNQIAIELKKHGVGRGMIVPVFLDKGWEQIVATLAVLKSGAAYLPINPDLPIERTRFLLEQSASNVVISRSHFKTDTDVIGHLDQVVVSKEHSQDSFESIHEPDALAYVIYTSGSSGQPKGVMISHQAAVNTIVDINRRFDVTNNDRVLGLSLLSFDLSVYDIFGILAAGGTLVLPESDDLRNPAKWLQIINDEGVTLWNSVPTLMEMFVSYLEGVKKNMPGSLRLAMLSGDWILPDLPDRIRAWNTGPQVISLGGATEASIWSILYPIKEVDPKWKSIPYGKPMENQSFHVLNDRLGACPTWVPGDLFIGGVGLAQGYYLNKEETKSSFILHPETGERLYRTGDIGRYLPDGCIEFLGREDSQVKIRGHRIELGEIEYNLLQVPWVKNIIVDVVGEGTNKHLVAYFQSERLEIIPRVNPIIDTQLSQKFEKINSEYQKTNPIDIDAYLRQSRLLDHASLIYMCLAINKFGIFTDIGEKVSIDEIMIKCCIVERYKKVIRQWLSTFESNGLIHREQGNTYSNIALFPGINELELVLKKLKTCDGSSFVSGILDYFERCGSSLGDLLKGDLDPLALLFPDGDLNTAENLYQKNEFSAAINGIAGQVLKALTESFSGDVKILEVGAGTGGTTTELLPNLLKANARYTFTDVSSFFTKLGKNKFSHFSFIDYGILNMEEDPIYQGFASQSYDIIIAANVLHGARDVKKALRHLRTLLVPGGALLLLEATQNRPFQMISMGLLEGFNRFDDFRNKKNLPLLSCDEWELSLIETGFDRFLALPFGKAEYDNLGMHVLIARNSEREVIKTGTANMRAFYSEDELKRVLQEKLPDYMIPSAFIAVDKFELNTNGKIDRSKLPAWNSVKRKKSYTAPRNSIEKDIGKMFEQVLNCDKIGVQDDFFELGGDSLLAIQGITKIKEKYAVEINLREFFKEPTVVSLATQVVESRASLEDVATLEQMLSEI